MLVFIVIGLSAIVCNLGQGQCIYIPSSVMNGLVTAGVVECVLETIFGYVKIYRKKEDDE